MPGSFCGCPGPTQTSEKPDKNKILSPTGLIHRDLFPAGVPDQSLHVFEQVALSGFGRVIAVGTDEFIHLTGYPGFGDGVNEFGFNIGCSRLHFLAHVQPSGFGLGSIGRRPDDDDTGVGGGSLGGMDRGFGGVVYCVRGAADVIF